MNIIVRLAARDELERVNELRRMVNDVHVNGRPDIFRPGFSPELRDRVYELFDSGEADIIVAVAGEKIIGFAVVNVIHKPQSPYNIERSYYHVEEFGVDEEHRRRGAAAALIEYIRNDAMQKGLNRVELDMWEFNDGARAFYEAVGFSTYRRYMEMEV